eukprot:m.164902 g.164902  ORF g.164902 m.164902 type:complete len:101 (-) comp15248_c0_seq7:483-785(-)
MISYNLSHAIRYYVGPLVRGKWHGKGFVYFGNESPFVSYFGDTRGGILHGDGILKWKNGARYTGGWMNSKRHGHGTMHYAMGDDHGRVLLVFVSCDTESG